MIKRLSLVLWFSLFPAIAAPPPADRDAILAMAGTHAVNFKFDETALIIPGYKIASKPYEESAIEVVKVVEDSPECIALQHLLVVKSKGKEPMVIKHWAQIWTWQDTEILDYCGEDGMHQWELKKIAPEDAAGTWSQLVTQVDDTPRYESFGKWVHIHGESYWESGVTRRPLPRREYTKREDYDYLLVTNRHSHIAEGWLHFQDNRKVVDRDNKAPRIIAHEVGLNTYARTESEFTKLALDWWDEHGATWRSVRHFWHHAGESVPKEFSYQTVADGKGLSATLKDLIKSKASAEEVAKRLSPYVVSN